MKMLKVPLSLLEEIKYNLLYLEAMEKETDLGDTYEVGELVKELDSYLRGEIDTSSDLSQEAYEALCKEEGSCPR
jgi:hypothetical protein